MGIEQLIDSTAIGVAALAIGALILNIWSNRNKGGNGNVDIKKQIKLIQDNHLHGLDKKLDKIISTDDKIVFQLNEIRKVLDRYLINGKK